MSSSLRTKVNMAEVLFVELKLYQGLKNTNMLTSQHLLCHQFYLALLFMRWYFFLIFEFLSIVAFQKHLSIS